ncbi:MAG TPA: sigma-70 family RNA polymerase sigma factor [Verrucomicrobiae bacterium]|jgi:RNA polymerase sigma factor (sigma-70 family)|nr:sigma-70 family RNA polymerase sigma factor [Verrucomicrobiae bacterium]
MTDSELLRRYARERSERAFEELVRRRINLVYSAALRQVNNDTHLAEDVTQAVFTDLARKAAKLARHPSLTAWLYTSTRFAAANTRRAEHRRGLREKEAHAMNVIHPASEHQPDWSQIRPLLDDAMHTLEADDREALLLRHFEQRSYSEIGSRFGLAEDAARMRVNRALGKLRDELAKRGMTSTVLAIATLLANNAVEAAPSHLAVGVARAAITNTAASGGLSLLLTAKIKLALAVLVIVAVVAIVRRNITETPATDALPAQANAIEASAQPAPPSVIPSSPAPLINGAVLHLQIVTADTGQPIPVVPIEYFAWAGHVQKTIRTDRHGICDVLYPRGITRLELVTETGPFADTRLVWQLPLGDIIPSNYILRVERAVPIGGLALDDDNNPVPGAIITWRLAAPNIAASKPSQPHEYYGTTYETTADQAGRWQINRISEAIIPYLMGQAKEINHVDSPLIFTSRDKPAEKQLREGTYVFKLSRGATVTGIIVDTTRSCASGWRRRIENIPLMCSAFART